MCPGLPTFRKHWFVHLRETWLGNIASCFVHLWKTWLWNNVSWFIHLRETWLENNVFWFVHPRETWLENNVFWFAHTLGNVARKHSETMFPCFHACLPNCPLTFQVDHTYPQLDDISSLWSSWCPCKYRLLHTQSVVCSWSVRRMIDNCMPCPHTDRFDRDLVSYKHCHRYKRPRVCWST